ncbi:MAG TPA: hypothetical protein P5072_08075, partial [Parvularculaceae bacterium]|nr:hypothetical protein [Parvularculaceae bacterium]
QQDGGTNRRKTKTGKAQRQLERRQGGAGKKKRAAGVTPYRSRNSQTPSRNKGSQEKERPMSRSNVTNTVAGFSGFVNVAISALAILMIAGGYFSAVGKVAGVA